LYFTRKANNLESDIRVLRSRVENSLNQLSESTRPVSIMVFIWQLGEGEGLLDEPGNGNAKKRGY
jgi:hypothetical protein